MKHRDWCFRAKCFLQLQSVKVKFHKKIWDFGVKPTYGHWNTLTDRLLTYWCVAVCVVYTAAWVCTGPVSVFVVYAHLIPALTLFRGKQQPLLVTLITCSDSVTRLLSG